MNEHNLAYPTVRVMTLESEPQFKSWLHHWEDLQPYISPLPLGASDPSSVQWD